MRLPAATMRSLADLVAAGWSAAAALAALPRRNLDRRIVRRLEEEIDELAAGGPLEDALARLGFEITAATLRGTGAHPGRLEAALRADAEARTAAEEALGKMRSRVLFFAVLMAALSGVVFFVAMIMVPQILRELAANLPGGAALPAALLRFEAFRDLWLALAAGTVLFAAALVLAWGGVLGRRHWLPFLHEARLRLPFLRAHAVHTASARLLEALAFEEAAGIPAVETLRRLERREPVPGLRRDLGLAAGRLAAGDPWVVSLRGTLFDTPIFADLAALSERGARPEESYRWAAAQHREQSVKSLRRAVGSLAALVLVPSFLFLVVLLHVASTTLMMAQFEAVQQEIEMMSRQVDQIILGE